MEHCSPNEAPIIKSDWLNKDQYPRIRINLLMENKPYGMKKELQILQKTNTFMLTYCKCNSLEVLGYIDANVGACGLYAGACGLYEAHCTI